jgi:TRAP-type C4-dicarboxylate transport system permease small subunit
VTPKSVEAKLRSPLGALVSLLLAGIAVLCFVEVVLRYFFARSLSWYDELAGYLLVWLTFLGAVLAQVHRQHIGIEELLERAPERSRRWMEAARHSVLLAVHLALLVYGTELALRFLGESASSVPVPMGAVYAVIPLSAALMVVLESARIVRIFR